MNKDLNVSGIYQIRNLTNNHIYVGSAININNRRRQHKYELNKKGHHSLYLQRAWNKYGEENFTFEKLIQCQPELLLFYEQQFLDQWKPEYNSRKIAESNKGYIFTKEARLKMSIAITGRKLSEELKNKLSLAHKGIIFSVEHKKNLSLAKSTINYTEKSVIDPNGVIHSVTYSADFCKQFNLEPSSFSKLLRGKLQSHCGWKLCQQ